MPTLPKSKEDMGGMLVESDSSGTDYQPQPPLKSVARPPSDMTSKIERVMPDRGVLTKTNVEAIVENCLTKWTDTLQSDIVKAVESTFEYAPQERVILTQILGLNPLWSTASNKRWSK